MQTDIRLIRKDILESIIEVRKYSLNETYVIVTNKPVPLDDDTAKYAIWLWLNKDIESHAD